MKVLLLSDSLFVARDTQNQLAIKNEDVDIISSVTELSLNNVGDKYDLIVICRAINQIYGDPQKLFMRIQTLLPKVKVIVTFISKSTITEYEKAGFRHFYIGRPLIEFKKYVDAVLKNNKLPLYAMCYKDAIIEMEFDSY